MTEYLGLAAVAGTSAGGNRDARGAYGCQKG